MPKLFPLFFITILFFSCSNSPSSQAKDAVTDSVAKKGADSSSKAPQAYLKTEGDSLLIPPVDIEVSLSQKAYEKLKKSRETIIIAAYFSGVPRDTTSKEYQQSGTMGLAEKKLELKVGDSVARIDGVKFSKPDFDSLADKDIHLLINIYSGRHSTSSNLLDCDILEDKMSVLQNRKFILKGKLIGEK